MTATANFNEVLSAAIDDMVENGFDSMERVNRWADALRMAAEAAATPVDKMEQMLNEGLLAVYRRMIDQGQIEKDNVGVPRFTIEMVKPKLRAALDRRIMASAELIKLNRRQTIDKTLQRFSGWATSVPVGGTAEPERAATKRNVRKSLAQFPFEERRVLIDQGHKLRASLSDIVATDGGAIAMTWNSHWRQPGYNYREDHKERDQKVYLLRSSWARDAGLVKPGDVGFYDDVTKVAEEVFCRCWATWIYSLRDMPRDMLTKKGTAALEDARERARGMSAA